jgi:peptide/nickel transport system permease protein
MNEQLVSFEAGPPPAIGNPARRMSSPPATALRQAVAGFARDRGAVLALAILVVIALVALLAPLIAPFDPNVGDPLNTLASPLTAGHLLGTDDQGRDILSRIVYGARLAIPEATFPVVAAAVLGTALGLLAGFYQGIGGGLVMRVLDVFFAVPLVLLGIAVAAVLGSGPPTVILSMAIVITPYIARVVYTTTAQLKHALFVEAARASGSGELKILVQEILPHAVPTVIVYGTINMGAMIVFAAGFGFLGLGAQPPASDWGAMIAYGMSNLGSSPWVSTVPGLVIVVASLAFNYVGDGLRIALDPRLRTRA